MKSLEKKIQKERAEVDKKLHSLKYEKFACIPDAEIATIKELKEINFQEVESKSDTNFPYLAQAQVGLRESKIELEKNEQVDLY